MSDRFIITKGEIFSRDSVIYDSKTDKEYVIYSIGMGDGNDYYETRVITVDDLVDILNNIVK